MATRFVVHIFVPYDVKKGIGEYWYEIAIEKTFEEAYHFIQDCIKGDKVRNDSNKYTITKEDKEVVYSYE